ncbi:uncharacterized protein LOC110436030 [Sorghum bicolor]|uniref:uncharacterized protein LOC110436030 n=1 Tax=Sorghum bicolor TaxID=4558 RepID=UPI000B4252FA|nr:uncharacterized protein LOC110436030 [Sorghum bicolor]|eukprot:XP_021317876.1 uncharacterized protein LOC110436030 [Sorghum bicolor]
MPSRGLRLLVRCLVPWHGAVRGLSVEAPAGRPFSLWGKVFDVTILIFLCLQRFGLSHTRSSFLRLKRTLEQAQPSMAKRLKAGAASKESGSPDPWPSTGVEDAPPRPLVGESIPPSPRRVEAPRPQEQEGAPEPPRSGVEGDPITISDGSGGDGPSKDARPMDEEAETSLIAMRMPWPVGLRSVEEQRKKEEEERELETRQQLQEEQRPQ